MRSPIYLNIGCGDHKVNGLINVGNGARVDLRADITQGLPFANSSIGGIFNEQFIEHLTRAGGAAFLRECRRVLVPGGTLRIATPDLDLAVKSYLNDDWRQHEWIRRFGCQWIDNRCEMLNVKMREWGQKWMYDEEDLTRMASLVGLSLIGRRRPGESDDPTLRAREQRDDSRLVVEFTKKPLDVRQKGLVSILIPSYNSRFFGQTLGSALHQTYQHFEILICDDNRSDDIARIASRYAASDSRIKYIKNPERLGEGENRLKCFGLANGEYIKFLNDDDLLHRDCLSRMVSCLEHHPDVVLVTSHRQLISENDAFLRDISSTQRPVSRDSIINGASLAGAALALNLNFIGEPTTTLFRKCDLETTRPNILCFAGRRAKLNGDMSMWLTLLSKGDAIYLTDSLSYFRMHAQQTWQQPEAQRKGREAWEQHRSDAIRLGLWNPRRPLKWIVEPLPEHRCEAGKMVSPGP